MTVTIETGKYATSIGNPHPLGTHFDGSGCNFSIFSEHATSVDLLLFDTDNSTEPDQVIPLDPEINNSFCFWHVYVHDVPEGIRYAYRVHGPQDAQQGLRFDPNKVLIDPYAKGNDVSLWDRAAACQPDQDNLTTSMRSVLINPCHYDWEGDKPLRTPMKNSIIYEMHVRGFTQSPTSGVAHPGTFAGVIEKIPYLKDLGITAVELLPVFEFDDTAVLREVDGTPLRNYWGYSTVAFFAPHTGYCISPRLAQQLNEFRDMVKALHKAGIEVILDVVFNHTDEGNHQGPTFSFRGIDNPNYYYLVPNEKQYYYDYTGCGNTFNCNHPIGDKFIVDCLKYWVQEMHVDGFRFDEGTVLSRGENGQRMAYPPVIWAVELDDVLAQTKVVAEAWDAGGLYEVGTFSGYRWSTWNGKFRDDVRRFVKGNAGVIGAIASRISGSPDVYGQNHTPANSVNFIAVHDGFTTNDLVSYNSKHNEANGEGNRDGSDDNLSWNCGVEGPSDDPQIEQLRDQQIKNFATILMLSQGVPLMLYGDEVRRTQRGNNNAYCQDNEISWFDWSLVEQNRHMLRFWQLLIDFRKRNANIHRCHYFSGTVNERGLPDVSWHGCQLNTPNWSDPEARALGFTLAGFDDEPDIHVMMNMYWDALSFDIPHINGRTWHRVIDTAQNAPEDIREPGQEIPFTESTYLVTSRSIVVLISK